MCDSDSTENFTREETWRRTVANFLNARRARVNKAASIAVKQTAQTEVTGGAEIVARSRRKEKQDIASGRNRSRAEIIIYHEP